MRPAWHDGDGDVREPCPDGDRTGSYGFATISFMPEHRVTPPPPSEGKVYGPASYFPSIEKTYGRPIQEWLDLAADRLDTERHMEVVAWLTSEYGMGHGHANAIVGYVKANLPAQG